MDIFCALKPLYYLSKFVGLISFSLHFVSRTGGHKIRSTGALNFVQNAYSLVIFCGITAGFVTCVQQVKTNLSTNPGQVVSEMFSVPTNFITSMACMVMMTVINRKEMMELVRKLCTIDDLLLEGKGRNIYLKTRRRMLLELIITFGVLIPFLCYDSYFFGLLSSYAYEVMSRLSIAVTVTAVLQFLWTMRFFRHRLRLLNEKVLDVLCMESDGLRKFSYASGSERYKRFCQLHSTGLEERPRSNKICNSFREGNVGKMSVLTIYDNNYNDLHNFQQQQITLHDSVSCILKLRINYNHIYEATLTANKVFGISIVFTLMHCFVSIVSHTYFTFLDNFTNFDELEKKKPCVEYYIANHVIWVIISLGKTVAISGSCHLVRAESKILVNNLQKLQLRHPIRSDVLRQLQKFSTQVSQNAIHFTACGFFSVNLSLLYTFIASSVTYVIILIQFKLN